jgi:transposase
MIQERIRQGVYIKDVAEELGVHPRTVSRALQRGAAPPGERPAARKSKLDRYKPLIDRLLAAGVWNAAVILRELQEQGYNGQASILRDYLRPKRPLRQARATVRFETAPGEQLQNDWAKYRTLMAGREQEVHFAVNTLGYSRRFHFVAMACEDAEHTYESLIQSFEYFGGVTSEVLVDNQKTEVISHRIGAAVEYNARFLELAVHHGFQPRACRPRRARTKGKDERMVHLHQRELFRALSRVRKPDASQSTGRAMAARGSRPAAARNGQGSGRRAFRARAAAPAGAPRSALRYGLSRTASGGLGRVYRGARQPLQRAGRTVRVDGRSAHRLDGDLTVYNGAGQLAARHRLKSAAEGWVLVPEHHRILWKQALTVERRELAVCEEVAQWS